MYRHIEEAITQRIADAVPGAVLHSTFDVPQIGPDTTVAVWVRWRGLGVSPQVGNASQIVHRFEIQLLIDAARVVGPARDAAIDAFGVLMSRLVGWHYALGRKLELAADTPSPEFDGGVAQLSTYFTTPAVIKAAP